MLFLVTDVPRLLAVLPAGNSKEITARIKQLEQTRVDPRVAAGLLRLVEHLPFTAASAYSAYSAAFSALAALGDDRVVARLETLARALPERTLQGGTTFREKMVLGIQKVVVKLGELDRPALSAEEEAILARIEARLEERHPPDALEGELLAAIYAAPNDDDPRLVYADWLLERESPRGEFIILQIRGGETTERERELLEQHGDAFLGPLRPAIEPASARFERGFVAACAIVAHASPAADAVAMHPAWATVKEFSLGEPHVSERLALRHHLLELGAKQIKS